MLIEPRLESYSGNLGLSTHLPVSLTRSGCLWHACTPCVTTCSSLQVYKGVVPAGEFSALVDEMSSGPCLAAEVGSRDGLLDAQHVVEALRQLAGPADPELGRAIRPGCLRARFGQDSRITNALHVTDLAEDGWLETQYVFEILAGG